MNFDLLVQWMSHVASGSWTSFIRTVEELSSPDLKTADLVRRGRRGRRVLSDLGFAEFFFDGSRNWRVFPSRLGGTGKKGVYMLTGARSASLVETLTIEAISRDVEVRVIHSESQPSTLEILCDEGTAESIAKTLCIEWSNSLPNEFISRFTPVQSLLRRQVEDPPINWITRSFNLTELKWVDGVFPKSACEFSTQFGERKYFTSTRKGEFIPVGRRESIYLAAALSKVQLVKSNVENSQLLVPTKAPLPEQLSRAACLCSGELASVSGGHFCYSDVPLDIASSILAGLGQQIPVAPMTSIRG